MVDDAKPLPRIVVYTMLWHGGAGLYAQGLAVGMAKSGYPITFIAPEGEPTDPAATTDRVRRICPARELDTRAPRWRRALFSLRRVMGGLAATAKARAASSRFVASIPDPFFFSLWLFLFLRLTGAQLIYVCHDPKPHAWKLPGQLRALEMMGHRAVYWLATRIVVLTPSSAAALTDTFAVAPAKIRVVPHGAFDFPSAGPVPGSRAILALGTIRRNKQAHLAIQAVRLARERGCQVILVVAGGPDPDDLAYLDECRVAAEGLEDSVTIRAAYLAEEDMMAVVAGADALVLPYADFASQSGVAVLAGMCGRPVIAAPAGGIADLMELGLAAVSIAAPLRADTIAAAIVGFYDVPLETWTSRAASARKALVKALDWRQIGEQFAEVFE